MPLDSALDRVAVLDEGIVRVDDRCQPRNEGAGRSLSQSILVDPGDFQVILIED